MSSNAIPALKTPLIKSSASYAAKIFMCDACCCGDPRFSDTRAPIEELQEALIAELDSAGKGQKCPVALTGCMGPCAVGNNVILATKTQNLFFKKMNQVEDLRSLGRFANALKQNSHATVPDNLKNKLEARETIFMAR